MNQSTLHDRDRHLRRRYIGVACSSLVLFLICSQTSIHYPEGRWSLALAGLGGFFFFAELVSVGALAMQMRDEFQRVLLTRSFLWATIITMAVTMIWGFVELHGRGTVPHMPLLTIPCLLVLLTTAAKLFIFRRHQSPAE